MSESDRLLQPLSVHAGQDVWTLKSLNQRSYIPDKNVGDVKSQTNSPEVKKRYGVPSLLLTEQVYSARELEDMGPNMEPPSLDPSLINLSMPPVDITTQTVDLPLENQPQKQMGNFKRCLLAAKRKYKCTTTESVDRPAMENVSEFGGNRLENKQTDNESVTSDGKQNKSKKKKGERNTKNEGKKISGGYKNKIAKKVEHSANDSQLSFRLTVNDVVETTSPELPVLCESQKLTDGGDTNTGLLMQNAPQLHRSPETLDQNSLLDNNHTVKKRTRSGSFAKQNKPQIQRDSLVTKSADRTNGTEKGTASPELSKRDQESQYSPPLLVENVELVHAKQAKANKSSKRNGTSQQPSRDSSSDLRVHKMSAHAHPNRSSESDLTIPEKDKKSLNGLPRLNSKKKVRTTSSISVLVSAKGCKTNRKLANKNKLFRKVRDSDSSLGRNEGTYNLSEKRDTQTEAESESDNSSWCRRICEEDKILRRNCSRRSCSSRKQPYLFKASTQSVRETPKSSPNQRVNVLIRQADNMIEELIDRLAWDMAEAIVSRASSTRTLSSQSLSRLHALSAKQRHSCADGTAHILGYLQRSRRSTPLVD